MKKADKEFLAEAEDILGEAGSFLLDIQDTLPASPDPDSINGLFRAMHTLKGMAGLYGNDSISEISHSLENVLDGVRMGKAEMTDPTAAFLFKYLDILRAEVASSAKDRGMGPDKIATHVNEIDDFISSGVEISQEDDPLLRLKGFEKVTGVLSEYEEHRLRSSLREGKGAYKIDVEYSFEDFDVKLKKISTDIKKLGELVSTIPASGGVTPGNIGFVLVVCSHADAEEINRLAGKPCTVMAEPVSVDEAASAAATVQEAEQTLKTATTTVREDIKKLDRLLNSVGEMALIKNNTRSLWVRMAEELGKSSLVIDLYKLVQQMERKLHELQENILEVRMVPIGQIFSRMGQAVRRYTSSSSKEISLSMFGEDTEIDKFLAEEIVDPLMHLVRNSIDHGIEKPKARKSAGKPTVGRIELKATQKGNSVVLEISDDGKGIDVELIKEKAIERGLIQTSAPMEDEEIMELIFAPGFSTKAEVSETSGRGVGLDVVQMKLAGLGGSVEVDSEPGIGTTFTLTLPITLAIVRALMVRVGTEVFALPLSALQETFEVNRAMVQQLEGGEVYNLRGEPVPVCDLATLLGIDSDRNDACCAFLSGHGERSMGFLIDELVGQQEIVIKPLTDYLSALKGFAGAAEVGSNEVVLVLDTEELLAENFDARRTHLRGAK